MSMRQITIENLQVEVVSFLAVLLPLELYGRLLPAGAYSVAVKETGGRVDAAMAEAWEVLKFQAWASAPDASFWQRLAALKLHEFRLDASPKVQRRQLHIRGNER